MTERRRAPIEVLERLAEAFDSNWKNDAPGAVERYAELMAAHQAYRAATAPLRTRAEVDADIATLLREDVAHGPAVDCLGYDRTAKKLRLLCAEPTSDEPAPPIGVSFPEPCSCEESTALHGRLRRIHQLTLTYDLTSREGAVTAIQAIRKACDE